MDEDQEGWIYLSPEERAKLQDQVNQLWRERLDQVGLPDKEG